MARIDVEEKKNNNSDHNNPKSNSKWWILAVIVIIAIIVAWLNLTDRHKVDVDAPPEPVVLKDRTGTRHLM